MRKAISIIVLFVAIILAGGFADTAIRDDAPLPLLELTICTAVMVVAFILGRLWEGDGDEQKNKEADKQ
jgi:hypothetical protein